MTHDEGRRLATVLVYDYDVREVVGTTCLDQLGVRLRKWKNLVHLGGSSVDSLRIGNEELYFLDEHFEARTRVARCGDAHLGVLNASRSIFIVHMRLSLKTPSKRPLSFPLWFHLPCQLYASISPPHSAVPWEPSSRLKLTHATEQPTCKSLTHLHLLLILLLLLPLQRLSIQVVSTQTNVSSKHLSL